MNPSPPPAASKSRRPYSAGSVRPQPPSAKRFSTSGTPHNNPQGLFSYLRPNIAVELELQAREDEEEHDSHLEGGSSNRAAPHDPEDTFDELRDEDEELGMEHTGGHMASRSSTRQHRRRPQTPQTTRHSDGKPAFFLSNRRLNSYFSNPVPNCAIDDAAVQQAKQAKQERTEQPQHTDFLRRRVDSYRPLMDSNVAQNKRKKKKKSKPVEKPPWKNSWTVPHNDANIHFTAPSYPKAAKQQAITRSGRPARQQETEEEMRAARKAVLREKRILKVANAYFRKFARGDDAMKEYRQRMGAEPAEHATKKKHACHSHKCNGCGTRLVFM